MADQTITTAVNYDAASIGGLANGEQLLINGGSVTIDADVRWNQQAAVFGNVTIDSSLGGAFVLDGTKIWQVPFSASTGNVPTQAALGFNGVTGGTSGATGELTRVWATGSLTPAAAGGAMPATGYIKLRSRTGNFQSGEIITLPGGATVIASGAGQRSWIHVVGRGVTSVGTFYRITVPRLGSFAASGDWFELGTTNGATNQTFQFPVTDATAAIWIETAPGSNVYEIWLNAFDRWTDSSVATADKRGMYFGMDAATGVITLARRSTTNAGFLPPSGCRVRVPNIICSSANGGTTPNYDANILPSNSGFRFGFPTSGIASSININNSVMNWLFNPTLSYSVTLQNSAFPCGVSILTPATFTTIQNVGISHVDTTAVSGLSITGPYGGSLTDVRIAKRLQNSAATIGLSPGRGWTLTRVRAEQFAAVTTQLYSTGVLNFDFAAGSSQIVMNDCISIGGRAINITGSSYITCNNQKYASRANGPNDPSDSGTLAINIATNSSNCTFDGFSIFENLANNCPSAPRIVAVNASSDIIFQNFGTASNPLNAGTTNPFAQFGSFATSERISLRRVFLTGLQSGTIGHGTILNSVSNSTWSNIWSIGADAITFGGNDNNIRGLYGTLTTPIQAYGIHWVDSFFSSTTGGIYIIGNEPTANTLAQCTASLNSAAASGFNGVGGVSMKTLTDSVEWTMAYFALGHTGFANVAPTITGTNVANHTFQFQYDTGSGWNGTWLALTGANLSGVGSINPATGVKLRVLATVNTASTSNLLTMIRINTVTNSSAQQTLYLLPGSIINVSNLVPQSRVKVNRVDTGAFLAQASSGAGTTVQFDVQYIGAVKVEARNASGVTAYKPWVTQVSISNVAATSVTALQELE